MLRDLQALLLITNWPSADSWHLIVDEIPSPDKFFNMHLPVNHGHLTDAITWRDYSADNLRVFAKDTKLLERYARNDLGDEIDALFQDMAKCILHPHYEVYTTRENLMRELDGDTNDGEYPLYMVGLLQPSVFAGFKSVVIMGANFTESLLYMLWERQGTPFKPHGQLTKIFRVNDRRHQKLPCLVLQLRSTLRFDLRCRTIKPAKVSHRKWAT